MNRYNLKVFKKAGQITSSIVLSTALVTTMPVVAYASVGADEVAVIFDNDSNKNNDVVSFSESYDTEEEALLAKKLKEYEYKKAGCDNVKGDISLQSLIRDEEFSGSYSTKEEAEKALADFANSKGGSVKYSDITENKTETENLFEENTEIIETTVDEYRKLLEEKVAELNKNGEYRLEISDPETIISSDVVLVPVKNEKDIKVFGTLEEAEDYINSLGESTELRVIKTNLTTEQELAEVIKDNINKSFSTKDEALAYIEDLKKQGYMVDYSISDIIESGVLDEMYDSKEEAEKALNDFISKYPQAVDSDILKIRDKSKDKTSTILGKIEYESEEAAKEAAAKLEEDNDEYKISVSIRKESKETTGEAEKISSEQFDDEAAAQKYIDELKKKGYDVSDLKIELVPFEETVWKDEDGVIVDPGDVDGKTFKYGHFDITLLTKFTKVDKDGNESTVTGSIKINDVKINNKTVNMNGLSVDPNTGLYEYTSVSRNDLNVTNKSLVAISGTVIYNGNSLPFTVNGYLSESQNVCGGKGNAKGFDLEFKSVKIVNNKVIIDSNIVNKYKVVGTAIKKTTSDVWYLDSTKTVKGYKYNVKASGKKPNGYSVNGEMSKSIYKDVYKVESEIITNEETLVPKESTQMSYKIYKKDYITEYQINGVVSVPYEKYLVTVTGENIKNIPTDDKQTDNEINNNHKVDTDNYDGNTDNINNSPVKTGDDFNAAIPATLAGIGLGTALFTNRRRAKIKRMIKKNN